MTWLKSIPPTETDLHTLYVVFYSSPICISICTVNGRCGSYVLYWTTTRSNQWNAIALVYYRIIQNFGGRKLWQNSLLQKLEDNILPNVYKASKKNEVSAFTEQKIAYQNLSLWFHCVTCLLTISLIMIDLMWLLILHTSLAMYQKQVWSTYLVWRQWFMVITNTKRLGQDAPIRSYWWNFKLWKRVVNIHDTFNLQ